MAFLKELFRLCTDFLFPPRAAEQVVRDATPEGLARLLSPRVLDMSGIQIVSLFPYRHELVRSLITEAKFRANEKAYGLLSVPLHEYLSELSADANSYEKNTLYLIPLPLSPSRMKGRGYNQVERLLTGIKSLHVELRPELLDRVRDTAAQTTLGRAARLQNMEGAFQASASLDPTHTYIVIDDVVTTGATLRAAHTALLAAGAKDIQLVALAH
jgi:ComF family protein